MTQTQTNLINFAKAHGFAAMAFCDKPAVAVFIPTWDSRTQESGFELVEVSSISQARVEFGY